MFMIGVELLTWKLKIKLCRFARFDQLIIVQSGELVKSCCRSSIRFLSFVIWLVSELMHRWLFSNRRHYSQRRWRQKCKMHNNSVLCKYKIVKYKIMVVDGKLYRQDTNTIYLALQTRTMFSTMVKAFLRFTFTIWSDDRKISFAISFGWLRTSGFKLQALH